MKAGDDDCAFYLDGVDETTPTWLNWPTLLRQESQKQDNGYKEEDVVNTTIPALANSQQRRTGG
jgi:hypothetical protein